MAVCTEDLQGLQDALRDLLEGLPLELQCSSQEGALMVLGQHPAGLGLEPQDILRQLERRIQALQIQFVRQARLYLRVDGEPKPYAHRFFLIQPPPPPPPKPIEITAIAHPPSIPLEQPWEFSDAELDTWLNELVGEEEADSLMPQQPRLIHSPLDANETFQVDPLIPLTEEPMGLVPWQSPDSLAQCPQELEPWADSVEVERSSASTRPRIDPRRVVAGGAIAMGMVSGVYGFTRPCVLNSCDVLSVAQEREQQSLNMAEQATQAEDMVAAQQQMQQAIAALETIPAWSYRAGEAHTLLTTYEQQQLTLDHLTQIAALAKTASDRSQNGPHSVETWQQILDLWQEALRRLDAIPPESPFYRAAQQQQQHYAQQHASHLRQMQAEETAQDDLNMAKQGIQMAETRQQIAQTPEQWQLVRITWQVVVNRLRDVPTGTYAAMDARRLLQSYEPRLARAITQVDNEQKANTLLRQATQEAQEAQILAQQFNWQGAIAAWTEAIRYARQIPSNTHHSERSVELTRTYTTAMEQAQKNLDTNLIISLEVDRDCNQEFRKCRLLLVGNEIRIQLTPAYLEAITVARNSGNRELQAVVAEHQLTLRKSLENLATRFQRPVEVYDDKNTLLDRHLPTQAEVPATPASGR